MDKFDVIIIGGGSAGYRSAELLSKHNKKILIIEKEHYIGGVCLNHGCIPTKAYINVCENIELINKINRIGIKANIDEIQMKQIKSYKDRSVKILNAGLKNKLLKKGIIIKNGNAVIKDNHTVKIENETFYTDYIIIATGSIDKQLSDYSFDNYILNSKTILSIDYIPDNLLIVGAGVIGIEMAQIFSILGSNVYIVEYMNTLLPQINNKYISDFAFGILKKKNIDIYTNTFVKSIDTQNKRTILSNNTKINNINNILISIGRTPIIPETQDINIKLNNGFIKTDKYKKTNIENIFAIGDCTEGPMLAHRAYYDANIAVNNILNKKMKYNYKNIPYSIFTIPPISVCGEISDNYEIYESLYLSNGRATIYNERTGFCKLFIDNHLIKGAIIIGKESDIIIHEIIPFIQNNIHIKHIKNLIHIHPTLSEIIDECINQY